MSPAVSPTEVREAPSDRARVRAQENSDQPKPPEKFQKSGGAGSGIIGLLEVCESDIAKNLAEEETEEASAATEYEKLTQENMVLKTMKEKDVEYKTREIKSLGSNMADLSSDYDDTSEELASLTEYFTKLKERCVAKPESYESRKPPRPISPSDGLVLDGSAPATPARRTRFRTEPGLGRQS